MLRLPNNALQKALIKLLKEKMQGVAVYDFVPIEATPPYITLGSIVVTDQSTKTEDNYKVDMQINIWSEYESELVNQMLAFSFLGSPVTIKSDMQQFLKQTQVDEIMAISNIYDQQAKLHSYQLFADVMKK